MTRQFNAFKFTVSNISDLANIIILHFDKYPLVGSKQLDFLSFKKAIYLYIENKNLYKDEILAIKNTMNKSRSFKERWYYLSSKDIYITPEWLQAFIDGEGSFQCSILNTTNQNKPYLNVNLTLEIAQSSHDIKVLSAIRNYFAIGYLKPKYDINSYTETKFHKSVSRLIITNNEVVINFVDKYPMFTSKHLDYLDWKDLAFLKK